MGPSPPGPGGDVQKGPSLAGWHVGTLAWIGVWRPWLSSQNPRGAAGHRVPGGSSAWWAVLVVTSGVFPFVTRDKY